MRRSIETNPVIPLKKRKLGVVRENRDMSRGELARRAEVHQNIVAWAESGRYVPYRSQLEKIADALDWPRERLEELMDPVEV